MNRQICTICPHRCAIEENHTGLCRARGNRGGKIQAINYGLVTSIALDPIEKKPLARFYPGSFVLSVGSFGCNFKCPFCQNHQISMAHSKNAYTREMMPDELVELAFSLKGEGNIGIAYTYNEPLVGYEYVYDCAVKAKKRGLKNVVVSNGYICREPLMELLPYIDAFNIDLKAYSEGFYHKIGGDLATVKQTIGLAAKSSHVEVTTLVIPGENDSEEEMKNLSEWLASVDPEIPLHLTRFFPLYKMQDKRMTEKPLLLRLQKIAQGSLRYVCIGNC